MVTYALSYLQAYGTLFILYGTSFLPVPGDSFPGTYLLYLVVLYPKPTFSAWWFCARHIGTVHPIWYPSSTSSLRGTYLSTWWFCTRLVGTSYLVVLYVEPTVPSYMVVLYPARRYILPGCSLRGTYLPTLVVLNPAHGYILPGSVSDPGSGIGCFFDPWIRDPGWEKVSIWIRDPE